MMNIHRKENVVKCPHSCAKDIGIDCPIEAQEQLSPKLMRKYIGHAEPAHKINKF
jgi:predicted small metal-binding protein